MPSKFHSLIYLVPIFLIFLTAYASRVSGYFSADNAGALGQFFFKFSIPAVIFLLLSKIPLTDIVHHVDFSLAFFFTIVIAYTAGIFLLRAAGMPTSQGKYFSSTGSFSNVAAVTLPILLSMPNTHELMHAFTLGWLIQLILFIIFVSRPYEGTGEGGIIQCVYTVVVSALKSPLVSSVLLGMLASVMHLELPEVVYKTLHPIGLTVSAVGLICMGLQFKLDALFTTNVKTWLMVIMKSVITPLIGYGFCLLFGLDKIETFILVIMVVCPTVALGVLIIENKTDLGQEAVGVMAGSVIFGFLSLAVCNYYLAV